MLLSRLLASLLTGLAAKNFLDVPRDGQTLDLARYLLSYCHEQVEVVDNLPRDPGEGLLP